MENWTIKEESLIEGNTSWGVDIHLDTQPLEIITVWGKTKEECLERAKLIRKAHEMKAALVEQIEIEKEDSLFTQSAISRERHHKRLSKLQSLLKDLK